jgi:putative Ca2+/H+ antiporter (TMEM165/GDT1 family)
MQRWVFHFLDLRKMWAHRLFEGIWFLVFGFWFWGSGDRRKKEKKRREEEDFFFRDFGDVFWPFWGGRTTPKSMGWFRPPPYRS